MKIKPQKTELETNFIDMLESIITELEIIDGFSKRGMNVYKKDMVNLHIFFGDKGVHFNFPYFSENRKYIE